MEIKLKQRKRVMSVRNAHGVKVKRCCASCKYKFYDEEGRRCCGQLQRRVAQKDVCQSWQMSEALLRVF